MRRAGSTIACVAALMLPTALGTDAAAATRPLAFWPLNEASAAVAHDVDGGHDATAQGAVRAGYVGQGPNRTAYHFGGGTAALTVPAGSWAAGAQALSVWVRLDRAQPPGVGVIVDAGPLVLPVAGGRLGGIDLDDGAWHQLVVSANESTLRVFLDGGAVWSMPRPATARPAPGGQVVIGRGVVGEIDDVALYPQPLTDADVTEDFTAGACPQRPAGAATPLGAVARRPALPLHTRGRYIVDRHGARVKLAGVNWYGAEEADRAPAGLQCQSADAIAGAIAAQGFNVVRLPWATDTWVGADPPVPAVAVAGDPSLRGLGAREVFDHVVDALARHGLMVVLDNHVGRPDWCCSGRDGNALWWEGYDPTAPPVAASATLFRTGQRRWLAAWHALASRYETGGTHPQPAVVGADLRNEPRGDAILGISPRWQAGAVPAMLDWPRAATLAGNRLLRTAPQWLIAVEGLRYATDLRGVAARPVRLAVAHRLVYSPHDYAFTQPVPTAASLRADLGSWWGWLITQHRWWTTPVWVGEFGTCHPGEPGCGATDARWFAAFTRYLADGDLDWTYWSINGTGARGVGDPADCVTTLRFPGCGESYGLLDPTWSRPQSPALSAALRSLAAPH